MEYFKLKDGDWVRFKFGSMKGKEYQALRVVDETQTFGYYTFYLQEGNRQTGKWASTCQDFELVKPPVRSKNNGKTKCSCGRWIKGACPKHCDSFAAQLEADWNKILRTKVQ